MVGAHNWQPMSFSPRTGLVYIPAIEAPWVFFDSSKARAGLVEGYFTVMSVPPEDYAPGPMQGLFGALPPLDRLAADWPGELRTRGVIRAWDPVTQTLAWERETHSFDDGGLMSTAGNLLFRGDAGGHLSVYAADTGALLERIEVGTGIMAAPMTYSVDGEQYVAVMAGFGGASGSVPYRPDSAPYRYGNDGRIVAFKLGGDDVPIPSPFSETPMAEPLARTGDAEQIALGEVLFNRYCNRCHPFGRAMLPDLRRLSPEKFGLFDDIVRGGILAPLGMGRFDDVLSRDDADALRMYLIEEAFSLYAKQR
jgi:quinohemoprotein ethanol dehydrogenase